MPGAAGCTPDPRGAGIAIPFIPLVSLATAAVAEPLQQAVELLLQFIQATLEIGPLTAEAAGHHPRLEVGAKPTRSVGARRTEVGRKAAGFLQLLHLARQLLLLFAEVLLQFLFKFAAFLVHLPLQLA